MNRIEADYTKHLWNTKHISEPDEEWFISKVFKTRRQILPIDEQKRIIEKKKEYFWEYIPETELIETENWGYIIRQKYIEWKTLAQTDVSILPPETLASLIDLIKKYLKYYREQWWELDLTWYQYYEWNPSNLRRKVLNFLKISQNFLTSTNIMIWDDWKVYMVDVCESSDNRLQWKIKNFCAKPFIKRTIKNLEILLENKLSSKKTSYEIYETLSD
jgi:hypothetical protein